MDEIITMEHEIIRIRNLVVSELAKETGTQITLSDEQDPTADPPYGYYSVISPYVSSGELGSHVQRTAIAPDDGCRYIENIRFEHPEMVMPFNFCSNNDAEAMQLTMKAAGWLLHEGRSLLSLENIVVLRVGNAASRSGLIGDEYVRRWGFDVTIRYKALTVRKDEIIQQARAGRKNQKEA